MSGTVARMEWTHRICERCWFDGNEAIGLAAPGAEGDAYRRPTQIVGDGPGACCSCGGMTITAIYFRREATRLLCEGRHEDLSWSRVDVRRVVP